MIVVCQSDNLEMNCKVVFHTCLLIACVQHSACANQKAEPSDRQGHVTSTKVEGKTKEEIVCWDLISKEALEMSVSIQICNYIQP